MARAFQEGVCLRIHVDNYGLDQPVILCRWVQLWIFVHPVLDGTAQIVKHLPA